MSNRAPRYAKFSFGALVAVFGGVGAIQLFDVVLKQYVATEFMARCIKAYPTAGIYVPFVGIGAISGIVVGLVIGAIGGAATVPIAASAALGVCTLHFLTAALVGGVGWAITNPALLAAPSIGAGLLLGALLGRKMRHA